MNKSTKLAAIHSSYVNLPKEGRPYSGVFQQSAVENFINGNLEKVFSYLHKAGQQKVDLVCTNEDMKGSGAYLRQLDRPELFEDLAEEIPGPLSSKTGEIAKLYSMHIAANFFEKDGDKFYNTSVLYGRAGEIIGKYRKVHLPPVEKWRLKNGKEFSVFDTDIGKIGFAICYDVTFPEQCRAVALNGANILIHQTQGWGVGNTGNALLRVRAAENSVYMIVSKNIQDCDDGKSCIIGNDGSILAEASGKAEEIITYKAPLDFHMVEEDHFNTFFSGISSTKARQMLDREPSLYSIMTKEKPDVLKQYPGIELQTAPEKIQSIFEQWKDYEEAMLRDKPVKIKYHW